MRLMDAGIEASQGKREVDRINIIKIVTPERETRERRGGGQAGRIECLAGIHALQNRMRPQVIKGSTFRSAGRPSGHDRAPAIRFP
jgi:hypothetical protein